MAYEQPVLTMTSVASCMAHLAVESLTYIELLKIIVIVFASSSNGTDAYWELQDSNSLFQCALYAETLKSWCCTSKLLTLYAS